MTASRPAFSLLEFSDELEYIFPKGELMESADLADLIDKMQEENEVWCSIEKIKRHPRFPCIVNALKALNDLDKTIDQGTALLMELLEAWLLNCYPIEALALLPEVTGENPVPREVEPETLLAATYWSNWWASKLKQQKRLLDET